VVEIYYQIRFWLEGTYTLRILENFWDLLFKIGPYLLISIGISVATTRLLRGKRILFSSRNEVLSVVSAACVGLVSPLPTYAAIPIALALMPTGVPFSAVMSFVIASPLMNPSVFFLTVTELGMEMAIARTATAFVLGVAGGLLVMTIFRTIAHPSASASDPPHRPDRTLLMDIWNTFHYTFKYFSMAILLSAAVKALVPPQAIADLLGSHAAAGTLVAVGLGVPFYTCGGAAIPFMETLMGLGMSKGATLAFCIAGPATKLETLYAFKTLLGVKVLLFYLALTFAFACFVGSIYSFF
jgi:uncharacterized membrane protein YraQ (UPF0718 family)